MREWFATTKGNKSSSLISESSINWGNVTEEIKTLSFDNNGQIISLPENVDKFIQGKTASSFVGSKNVELESRYIGFIYKNIEFKIRIDEKTNNITVEVK